MSKKVKYIDGKLELYRLNRLANLENRQISDKTLEELTEKQDNDTRYPINMHVLEHDGRVVRIRVMLNAEGVEGFIDTPIHEFNNLPTMEVEEREEVKQGN